MIKLTQIYMTNSYNESMPMTGTITFKGEMGEVKLNMSPEQVAKVVNLFAEQIVSSVKESAAAFSLESVGVPALEHKNVSELESDIPF